MWPPHEATVVVFSMAFVVCVLGAVALVTARIWQAVRRRTTGEEPVGRPTREPGTLRQWFGAGSWVDRHSTWLVAGFVALVLGLLWLSEWPPAGVFIRWVAGGLLLLLSVGLVVGGVRGLLRRQ